MKSGTEVNFRCDKATSAVKQIAEKKTQVTGFHTGKGYITTRKIIEETEIGNNSRLSATLYTCSREEFISNVDRYNDDYD
jgi:hypothetical protein